MSNYVRAKRSESRFRSSDYKLSANADYLQGRNRLVIGETSEGGASHSFDTGSAS